AFFSSTPLPTPHLPSFPTRRSSDLYTTHSLEGSLAVFVPSFTRGAAERREAQRCSELYRGSPGHRRVDRTHSGGLWKWLCRTRSLHWPRSGLDQHARKVAIGARRAFSEI